MQQQSSPNSSTSSHPHHLSSSLTARPSRGSVASPADASLRAMKRTPQGTSLPMPGAPHSRSSSVDGSPTSGISADGAAASFPAAARQRASATAWDSPRTSATPAPPAPVAPGTPQSPVLLQSPRLTAALTRPASALPAPLRWIKEAVFDPCFVEGEDFAEFIRKAAVLTYSVMASAGWMLCLFFGVFASKDDNGFTPVRINMIAMGLYMMIWYVFGNYIFIRRTGRCPLWLADLASVGAMLGMASFTIATLEADTRVLLMSTQLLTAMCGSPRFPLHAVAHGLVYTFHYLRTHFRSEIPALAFPWDRAPDTTAERVVIFFVLSVVPSLGSVMGMYVVISNYIRRSQEGQAAFRMTLEIAEQLQRYDVDGMLATITKHDEGVDAKLLAAFSAICDNLKTYRPHIPLYLIQAAIERAEQQARELAESLEATEKGNEQMDNESEGSLDLGIGRSADSISVSSRTSRSSKQSHTPVTAWRSGSSSFEGGSSTAKPFMGVITSLYLVLGIKDALVAVREINAIVETINHLGKMTNASIHHVDGDAFFVTWNATTRVGNHEIRACNFTLKVIEALSTNSNLSPKASIMTCHATAMFAGTSHVHFTVLSDELRRHAQQLRLASDHHTIVCNGAVAQAAETQFTLIGFDLDDRSRPYYELVKARSTGDGEEWQYLIQSCNHDEIAHQLVSTALQQYINGDVASAHATVASIPENVASRSTVQSLMRRIAAA